MAMTANNELKEIALRIREMRDIFGFSTEEMAEKTEVTVEQYEEYETGALDFPFTFIHKCSQAFNVGITDLLEGRSARLSSYTVTRKGQGLRTAKEDGIEIMDMAPLFQKKIAEPYWVRYEFDEELQKKPIHQVTHSGQEFDFIVEGHLKIQVGDNVEYLSEGDSIYYNSSTPHGMIAVDGRDCLFVAVILPGEKEDTKIFRNTLLPSYDVKPESLIASRFITTEEDENGELQKISFKDEEKFNFAFDIVDKIAERSPDKLAMIHVDKHHEERRFTFRDMKRYSGQCANFFKSLGIGRGDRVMLVLKRHYQFWFAILGLHKLGAVAIPATNQLQTHDFEYRFKAAGVKAVICTSDDNVPEHVYEAEKNTGIELIKILVNDMRLGWHSLDEEMSMFSAHFYRTEDSPCGSDPMLMFFTSGTTGYPKIAEHNYKYPLGHYITAKYWHGVSPDGLHFTISDTGWGKALWGKIYGQWLCESAVFVYDFDRFDAADLLPMIHDNQVTTFCAPPTMYRFFIREDLSKYDLSNLQAAATAGEALNPEVFNIFKKATGLNIMEGFGQTESTLLLGNLIGMTPKPGSMGKPAPPYNIVLLNPDGEEVQTGEVGEICVRAEQKELPGLFLEYFRMPEQTQASWHDGFFHTGDTAWKDEDGYFWYVGRCDDLIKSSGYRIGPFEVESVMMELPYVLECAVVGAPDPVRGQIVKAYVVLTAGTEGNDALRKEIQNYVKANTAPYKYPRQIEFVLEMPKTPSGKIRRAALREMARQEK